LIEEITRLTRQEFDEFISIANGRLKAIEALEDLCARVDFGERKNEGALHGLLKENPWIIDPTYFEFFASNRTEASIREEIEKHLGVASYVPKDYDPNDPDEQKPLGTNLRPDLVFLLGNEILRKLVIVELKAPNLPLHMDHYAQLTGYMESMDAFLRKRYPDEEYQVEGLLIGSIDVKNEERKVLQLRAQMRMHMKQNCPWRVYDIHDMLKRTKRAHWELLKAYRKAKETSGAQIKSGGTTPAGP